MTKLERQKVSRLNRQKKKGTKRVSLKQTVVSSLQREGNNWYDGSLPNDSARSIMPYKQKSPAERRICSFITAMEGHSHIITPASKAEELQDLADRL